MEKRTTNHHEIRSWIEKERGRPAIIDHPEAGASLVGIRVDFPGEEDETLLEGSHTTRNISWEEFFNIFDEEELVFVYEEEPRSDDPTQWYHYEKRENIAGKQ